MSASDEMSALVGQIVRRIPALTPEQIAEQDAAEQRRRETELLRWLKDSGVPKRFLTASLDGGKPTSALRRVADAIHHGEFAAGRCLMLVGPTGVGKTFAAAAALRALRAGGRFWPWPAASGALLDPARRGEALQQVKSTSFLVLDDLGAEFQKEGGLVQAFLDEIIDHRYGNELATAITSNLTADDLKTHLSARIVDRLREWGTVFECPGESLR